MYKNHFRHITRMNQPKIKYLAILFYSLFLPISQKILGTDNQQKFPLHHAIMQGDKETAKQLIRNGTVDIFAIDKSYRTPLHIAAIKGDGEIFHFLVQQGANCHSLDKYLLTPWHLLIKHNHNDNSLLNFATICSLPRDNTLNDTGFEFNNILNSLVYWQPRLNLDKEVQAGDSKIVRLLRKANKDLRIRFNNDTPFTPLHIAVREQGIQAVEFVLGNGFNVNATDSINHWTPLHLAAAYGKQEVARLLLASGADIHATDELGQTPLHIAFTLMLCTRENNTQYLINRINILAELLLWYKYQTYNYNTEQQAIIVEIQNTFHPDFSNALFRNQAAPWVQWIMTEIPECESKEEFFEKIFDYLLGSHPEEQQKLLTENVKHLFLMEHKPYLYSLKNNLSDSQHKKLKEFQNLLTWTYAEKIKKDLFHELSQEHLENQLQDLPHLKELTNAIMKYCQKNLTKSPFLKAILKKYQAKQNDVISTCFEHSKSKGYLTSSAFNNMFKSYAASYIKDTSSLIRDVYLHLDYIIQQNTVTNLNSDTQFGKNKDDQKILIFEN